MSPRALTNFTDEDLLDWAYTTARKVAPTEPSFVLDDLAQEAVLYTLLHPEYTTKSALRFGALKGLERELRQSMRRIGSKRTGKFWCATRIDAAHLDLAVCN